MPITITQGTSRMTKKSLEGRNGKQEDSTTSFIAGDDISALGAGVYDNVSLDGQGQDNSLQVKGFLKPDPDQKKTGTETGSTFLILARMEKKGGAPKLVYLDATGLGGGYPPDENSLALIKISGTDKIEIKGFADPTTAQLDNYSTNVGVTTAKGSSNDKKQFLVRDFSDSSKPKLKFVNLCGGLQNFEDPSAVTKRLTLRTCITPDVTTEGTIQDKILFPVWDNSGTEPRLSYTTLDAPKITGGNYAFVTTTQNGKEISIEGVHYISGDNTNVVFTTDPDDPKTIKIDVYYK